MRTREGGNDHDVTHAQLDELGAAPSMSTSVDDTASAPTLSAPTFMEEPDDEFVLVHPSERYVYSRTLGKGGMGEIRLCKDRHIGREVAMKVVLPEHEAAGELRSRFLREARVQGQLEHPAIVPVYDLGRDDQGHDFFTMKRVRGETLADVLERLRAGDPATIRDYPRHKLLGAFTRVCLAIDFAHARGVIHRDLKPTNVMLGGFGEVYVLDWGVARVLRVGRPDGREEEGVPNRVLAFAPGARTALGAILGTPAYMAPEQIPPESERVDARTDVYGLGAILFEILTLERLHGADEPRRMLERVREGVDARPSVRAPERDVPPELEAACVRATAKRPADRYASARALADAIDEYLNGDRDLELRRELAQQHLLRAREAALDALSANERPAARTVALREVGRAIALSPENGDARALLVRLLTEPPKSPPLEVVSAVEQTRVASQRTMLRLAAVMYACVGLLFASMSLALGVRDWRLAAIPAIAWLVTGATAYGTARFDHSKGGTFRQVTVVGAVAIAATTLLHGVLVVVPTLAAVNAMGHVLTTSRRNRLFVVAMNALAVIVPTGLVWLGIHPVQHVFVGLRRLEIASGALLWPRYTLLLLSLVNVVAMLMGARFGARYRDALTAAETRHALQSWQLRRLVPDEAIARSSSSPPRTSAHRAS